MNAAAVTNAVGEAFRPPRDEPNPAAEAFSPPERAFEYEPVRKRNRLPLPEYHGAKAYLLTLATAGRELFFRDSSLVEHCLEELRSAARATDFDVLAYCFMPDHLHLLVAGVEQESYVVEFVKRFKQQTGYWFRNNHSGGLKASPTGLWQRSYHDHILRSDESFRLAAEYVLNNPVVAGLAAEIGDYPYAGSFVWHHLKPKAESGRAAAEEHG